MLKRIRKSITIKWVAFSILLSILPLTIAGLSIIRIFQQDLKKSIIEVEKENANRVKERTEAFFERVTGSLLYFARDENIHRGDIAHRRAHFEDFLYQSEYLEELALLDKNGLETLRVSKHSLVRLSDLGDRSGSESFRVASKGQIHYGDFYLTNDVVPTLVISIPVERKKGPSGEVLCAMVHLRYLWNLLPQTQIGKQGSTYVVDRRGELVAHPDTRLVLLRKDLRHLPMVSEVVNGKEGNLEFEHPEGGKYLAVYKPIRGLGWGTVVQIPVEEAYEPLQRVANTALKWMFVALIIAVAFSLFLARKWTLPIKRLSAQMVEVSKGNLDVHIETTTRDEFGLLTGSFNQMIRDLNQSHKALKEAEEKYRRIFENSKDMVFITSVDGQFFEVNRAGVELLGYTRREELQGLTARDTYLDPEDRKRFQEEMAREGFVKDFEVKLKTKDRGILDCLITATVRKDEEGKIVGYEGIIKNISDRKRMEEELFQRTRELQTLYDLSVLVNQSLDLNEILSKALDRALALTGFEMGTVHLLDKDNETLELKLEKGHTPSITEHVKVLKVGEGVCGKVVKLKRPLILSINEYPTSQLIPLLEKEGIRTFAGIPLVAKEKAIGSITLMSRSSHSLTEREISLLENIGMQIGLALENAKLFSAVARGKSEWETTFDAVTDLITIRDREYRILRANKAAFKRYGLAPRAIIGRKCYETLHHRDIPCEGCYVSETLRTRKAASGERESKYLNGVFHYFTFPVWNEGGEFIAVVDLAREITEQKRLEVEKEVVNNINRILASSLDMRQVIPSVHSELKRVLNSERMTITLSDREGKGFRYFAPEEDEDAEGRGTDTIFPSADTPFEQVVCTGKPILMPDTEKGDTWTNQALRREGIRSHLVFPLEYQGRVIGTINFGSGTINHFSEADIRFLYQVATGLAISIENSLLLDEIKGSEERYRTVVENAHDGVGVIGDDFRFRYANQRLAEIYLYSREELIGMDFRNLLDEESRRLVADRYVRRQKGDEVPSRYEFNIVRKDREIRNVEISSSMVNDSKGNVNTISFIKDITEKKRLEEKFLQTEKLRALGEMASGVAHDFNNSLAVILGNAQLMLYTVKDEEVRKALRTVEKVAQDSAHTVKQLQEFTRTKRQKELFSVDINAIIQDAVEMTRPRWKDEIQRRGRQIEIALDLGKISPVSGNDSELREVMTNVVFNAIEAMPEGGKIDLRSSQKEKRVSVEISDTGVGMTEEVKKKIFEPFFTTKPFSNTGLGLSMSYGIINRLGGEIDVQSKAGKGTTFTITLPVHLGESGEIPPPPLAQCREKARILVIDDDGRHVLGG